MIQRYSVTMASDVRGNYIPVLQKESECGELCLHRDIDAHIREVLKDYTQYLMDRNFCDDDVIIECDAVSEYLEEKNGVKTR